MTAQPDVQIKAETYSYTLENVSLLANRRATGEGEEDAWAFNIAQTLSNYSMGAPVNLPEGTPSEVLATTEAKRDEIGKKLVARVVEQRKSLQKASEKAQTDFAKDLSALVDESTGGGKPS